MRHVAAAVVVMVIALAMTTLAVGALEGTLRIPDASATYLLAVVSVAVAFGTPAAVAIAIVTRYPLARVVLCGDCATGRTIARLAPAAASAGVVLEPRLRQGGGWDIEVRAA